MYATENYVKQEVRDLRNSIKNAATDLGGDIKTLYEHIQALEELIEQLQMQIEVLSAKDV